MTPCLTLTIPCNRLNRRRYSCVAVSANNQVVTPKSNVLDFTTGQAA